MSGSGGWIKVGPSAKYCRLLGTTELKCPVKVKKAYYQQVRRWHPDRWVHAAEEKQREAERMMAEINAAYDELRRKDLFRSSPRDRRSQF